MLLWMTRWLAASLNLALCGIMSILLFWALPYEIRCNMHLPCADYLGWLAVAFIGGASLCAATGFLCPRLLRFGLRWNALVALAGSSTILAMLVNDFFNDRYIAGQFQWNMFWVACGFGTFWAGLGFVIYLLACRQK